MLKQFNSNSRQLNRIVKKYNLTNISASVYEGIEVSGSNDFKTIMGDYINQSYTISSSFDGRDINGNPYEVDINGKPILNSQSLHFLLHFLFLPPRWCVHLEWSWIKHNAQFSIFLPILQAHPILCKFSFVCRATHQTKPCLVLRWGICCVLVPKNSKLFLCQNRALKRKRIVLSSNALLAQFQEK